jgi:serine protease Do
MEQIKLAEIVEQYVLGELPADELAKLEQLRKTDSDVDHFVMEQILVHKKLDQLSTNNQIKALATKAYNEQIAEGNIKPLNQRPKGKLIQLIKTNWKSVALASSVAGLIALCISLFVTYKIPGQQQQIQELKGELQKTKAQQQSLIEERNRTTQLQFDNSQYGGTAFLVAQPGVLATSYHVVANKKITGVRSKKGIIYKVKILYADAVTDIAILQIIKENEKELEKTEILSLVKTLPKLSESIFTLGYPGTNIVYSQGYFSGRYGFAGDTNFNQLYLPASPGQSGSPIFNENGEVLGILSTKQKQTDGVTFASKSKKLQQVLEKLAKENKISLAAKKHYATGNKQQVVEKLENYIYKVKAD